MLRRFLVAGLLLGAAARAQAQVGHAPSSSPFRQLTRSQFLAVYYGRIGGDGGALGIGPHGGNVIWIQHDFLADRPLGVGVGGGTGQLDRRYVAVNGTQLTLQGPVQHRLMFLEAAGHWNITGGKSWYGFAPQVNLGVGVVHGEKVDLDQSGYEFGTKVYFTPGFALRYHLGQKLALRAEIRTFFWKVSYPSTYQVDPDDIGPERPLLTGELSEWSPTPMLSFGIAYSFRRPF